MAEIMLNLNDELYLSSKNNTLIDKPNYKPNYKPLESGYIMGSYYGSSSRIEGGEIWNPTSGYAKLFIRILVNIPEESKIHVIFEQYVDFVEECVKLEELKSISSMKLEKFLAEKEEREPSFQKLLENKNKVIEGIRAGITCNAITGTKIVLKNELYEVVLFLRDLHRFEGEVQISGCRYKLL